MIIRENYLKQIRAFYDSDLIKIITGVRRCGKSIILEQIKDEIKSDNIIYLNFEDERILSNIPNSQKLLEYVDNNKKEGLCYLFFDEIQEVEDWQKACKTLRLHNNSLFITGSNSKILSSEFTKEFSGRYVSFRIRPFVYKELQEYAKETHNNYSITDYLIWGGFPKILEFSNQEDRITYLSSIYDSIVTRDILLKYNIQNVKLFKRITNYILKSNAREFSSRSIEKYLKNEHIKCSINTIIKYLSYLENAYIIDIIKPYSNTTKKELSYYFKVYNCDVSFNSLLCLNNRYEITYNLENIVYNELLYMGYKVKVFKDNDKEIDFIANKENKNYYIQVAYTVTDSNTYEREFKAFDNIDNSSQKILITTDDINYSTSTVKHIKLDKFLELNSLDD